MDPPGLADPSRKRRSPAPDNLGSLKFPFVYVPGDGTRVGRFVPRGSGAEFIPHQYCSPGQPLRPPPPPPPPPGYEEHCRRFGPRGSGAEFLPHQYCSPGQPLRPPPPPPPGCDKEHLHGPSAQTVQHDAWSSNMVPGATTPSASAYPSSPQQQSCYPPRASSSQPVWTLGRGLTPSLGPPLRRKVQFEWGIEFFIRIDRAGYHHVYPHVGGPFHSLQEADYAIERYLNDRRDPKMYTFDNVSPVDIAVRQSLYFPDGTRRRRLRSEAVDEIRDSKLQLVKALVDKYNEDNNLFGDLAYELNAVKCYQSFCEGDFRTWFHHINFTAKTQGAVSVDIFFAEVIFTQVESEGLPVSCLCMVKPTDNGACFACTNHGSVDMKHPNYVGFAGGHVMKSFMPINGPKILTRFFEEESLEAEESRLRNSLQYLDDPQLSMNFPGSLARKYPGPPRLLGSMQQGIPLSFPSGGASMQFAPSGW